MKTTAPFAQAPTVQEELPASVQEALGELVEAAREGLLALSVGIGLGVLAELIGTRPYAEEPVWAGMVLSEAPSRVAGIEVRKVEELDEAIRCVEITTAGFPKAARKAAIEQLRASWPDRNPEVREGFAAYIDGRLVACATAAYLDRAVYLSGGATVPAARGRGAYRALVRARWDEAVRRRTPMLIVQAGTM